MDMLKLLNTINVKCDINIKYNFEEELIPYHNFIQNRPFDIVKPTSSNRCKHYFNGEDTIHQLLEDNYILDNNIKVINILKGGLTRDW
jgi:hypothetical protein